MVTDLIEFSFNIYYCLFNIQIGVYFSYRILFLNYTLRIKFKVFEWCPIADSKTLSQTQMVSNTQNYTLTSETMTWNI